MKYQNRFIASNITVQFSNGSVFKATALINKIVESSLDSKSSILWNEKVRKKKSFLGLNKNKLPFYKFPK